MIPGMGKNYIKTLDEPIVKQIQCWVYSKADGKKIAIHTSNDADVYIEELRPAHKLDEKIMTETELLSYAKLCDQKIDSKYFDPNRELNDRDKEIRSLMTSDENYNYKGYDVKLKKHEKIKNTYYCTVYLNEKYVGGLRGPAILLSAKEWAQNMIDKNIAGLI
jgi:hypothetical protein